MSIKDWGIRVKLGVAFGLVLALLITVASFSIGGVRKLAGLQDETYNTDVLSLKAVTVIGREVTEFRLQEWRLLALATGRTADSEILQRTKAQLEATSDRIDQAFADGEKARLSPEKRAKFGELKQNLGAYQALHDRFVSSVAAGDRQAAAGLMTGEMKSAFDEGVIGPATALREEAVKHAAEANESAGTTANGVTQFVTVLSIVAMVASVAIGVFLYRAIGIPISLVSQKLTFLSENCVTDLSKAVDRLAQGDLTATVTPRTTPLDIQGKDEVGQLAATFNNVLGMVQGMVTGFNTAQANLRDLLRQVTHNSDEVQRASTSVSEAAAETSGAAQTVARSIGEVNAVVSETTSTSDQLARGSEQLASSAQDAATATSRLKDAIEKVQAGSKEQQDAALQAAEIAQQGGVAMRQSIQSMEGIERETQSSVLAVKGLGEKQAQIGAIVQTIDDIAAQTNLLALNAAIEAARAGEHGRGFAVVADEVRKLAERCGQATKEIGNLIESVNESVEEAIRTMDANAKEVSAGGEYTARAREALEEILTSIEGLHSLAEQNANAVGGMAQDANSVEEAINVVASVSQEASAGAEELNASMEETAASSHEIAASVQEQTAKIEEVDAMARQLNHNAEELRRLVAQFKIDGEDEAHASFRRAA